MSTTQDATVNVHVNNQEAEQTLKQLQERSQRLRQDLAQAHRIDDKGTIAKLKKELKETNKVLENAALRSARIKDAMKLAAYILSYLNLFLLKWLAV